MIFIYYLFVVVYWAAVPSDVPRAAEEAVQQGWGHAAGSDHSDRRPQQYAVHLFAAMGRLRLPFRFFL